MVMAVDDLIPNPYTTAPDKKPSSTQSARAEDAAVPDPLDRREHSSAADTDLEKGADEKDVSDIGVVEGGHTSHTETVTDHHDDDNDHHNGSQTNEKPPTDEPLTRLSSFARSSRVVPRNERRGLLAQLAIIPEIESPYEYRNSTKWLITAIVALVGAAGPMGSGIFLPALPSISDDLGASETVTNLTIAFYMLAMSIFPLWWSSFSETLGRRTIYLVSFSLFVLFSVLSAISRNIAMLVVMRILGGGASASVQAVGAGTIADLWEPAERGRAMGFFYLGPLIGPLLSPIIGGSLAQGFGWRATMWFLAIFGGVMLLLLLFCLPETLTRSRLPPRDKKNPLTRTTSRASSISQAASLFHHFVISPLHPLTHLRHPPVLITVYTASIAFFSLFIMNISVSHTFSSPPYNLRPIPVGLLYLGPSLGYIAASMLGGRWIDRIMAREARKAGRWDPNEPGKLVYLPEDRMRENMWLASTLYPGALIWYGWTAQKGVHFIIPTIANFFFGCGSMLVFGAVTTMLTEFLPRKSSSGVAVNNFVRNIFSCVGSVVAQPLIEAMGNGWLCTMVGLVAWVTGNVAIWALRKKGAEWRVEMDRRLNKGR